MGRCKGTKVSKATKCEVEAADEAKPKHQEASHSITDKTFKHMSQAAQDYSVPYDTFHRRHQGTAQSRSKAQTKQRLLTDSQEATVCEWVEYLGMTGHPLWRHQL